MIGFKGSGLIELGLIELVGLRFEELQPSGRVVRSFGWELQRKGAKVAEKMLM